MRTSRSYLVSILSFLLIIFIISNISSDIHKNENFFHVNDDIIATSLKIHDRNPRSAIHYTVVDRYASGEKVIREVRNSLEYSPTSRIDQNGASQPLSSYKTNLLGSDEIGILTRNPTNSFTGASTIGRYSDHVNLDYNSSTPIGTLSQIGKGGSVVGPVIEGQLAAGDLDGNFREEIVFAGILNSELNIKIGENWGDYGFGVRAHTTNTHLWPTSQVLTVTTGDYDGDTIDEFAVLGLSGTQPNIWVFEDLINSTPNQEQYLYYGDVVVFRSVNGPDRYVYSTGTATGVLDGKDVPEINAPTDTTIQFVLEDPENRNSTDLIQFGDNVLIRDFKGNYWTDHNMSGFAETWPMPQIIGQPPVVTDQQRWILHSDRPGNPAVGALTPNCYVSFQNNFTGRFIRAYAQYEMVSDNTYPADWFRVFNNNTLPRTFTQIGLKPIATLTNTNFQKLDILPSSWEHDIGKLIATKGMVSGNIDNDMMEELIVIGMDTLGWARAWIYDDALTDFTLLHEISWVNSIQNIHPNVALTNLDDDKPFEIVFSFSKSTFGKLEIYDDQTNGFSRLQEITSSGNSLYGELTNLATGDIDADGYDEIVFVNGDPKLASHDGYLFSSGRRINCAPK